ncbi:MAG: ribonuclease H-like domain-containing protein, partial [Candidatus Diapherotrites archaeon]|nr:ribonuclease H-like domain-containing protein [Candidatus Diapherotrites archaeon]
SIEIGYEEKEGRKIIKEIKHIEKQNIPLNIAAVDIETYAPGRFSVPEKDPIIMISYASSKEKIVFAASKKCSKEKCRAFENEKEMLAAFIKFLKEKKLDVIVTYNGDNFDFPYFKERCKKLGLEFNIGFGETGAIIKKRGIMDKSASFKAVQHIDAFQMLRTLSRFTVVSLVKYDLESVVQRLYGYEKKKIGPEAINSTWETGKGMDELVKYNLEDSDYTLRIALDYFQLVSEFCVLVKQNLFDVSRASASQLVEALLMREAFLRKEIVPNKPSETSVTQRLTQRIKGGYVKEPISGLHENIAVVDFRSLYPSVIIAHNTSPETLNCAHEECKSGKNVSPNKDWFCEKGKGFFPTVLEKILNTRIEIKKKIKKISRESKEFRELNARQLALKILLNSHYGYLAFSRARWYSRESAAAITAWSRHYVQEVAQKAEKTGFSVLYGDTDSAFLKIPKTKSQEDVKNFIEKINSQLPGAMELELEGFFKRGIFVTKREGTGAAKKRYALIDFEDKLKIVGFEYVRRDWSRIAKETQRNVIASVLKEGKPEKAIKIIRKTISDLKAGKTPKMDLVIMTQIQRPLGKYESVGPHVAAAKKAVQKGKEIGVGSVVSYVVTRAGDSISDKAQLEEYVKEGNYDADYYITHQIVPSVIHIMRELGYTKDDLIEGGKQQKLGAFG